MNYIMEIKPALAPRERHRIQECLKTLGFHVSGAGTRTDMSVCYISFDGFPSNNTDLPADGEHRPLDIRSYASAEVIECLLKGGAYKATKYLNEKLTVKATRKRYKGKIVNRMKTIDIILTIGAPNYEERQAIKKAKKVEETLDLQVKVPK